MNSKHDFSVKEYSGSKMRSMNIDYFINTVYHNFLSLSRYPILKHTKNDIHLSLTSDNLVMFTIIETKIKRTVAYVVGEIMQLDDKRNVLFISYLYVSAKYRKSGLGSILMDICIQRAHELKLNAVMLICDTEDENVLDFYLKRQFMYDHLLRRYDRYDVLSRNVY